MSTKDSAAPLLSDERLEIAAQAHLRHHDDAPCNIPRCLIASFKEGAEMARDFYEAIVAADDALLDEIEALVLDADLLSRERILRELKASLLARREQP